MERRRIAFNLAFVEDGPLTGPGFAAVETFKALHTIVHKARPDLELSAFIRTSAAHHIPESARDALIGIEMQARGRFGRVLWEQVVLPFRARAREIDLLFSPAFVSPMWGAPHLVVFIHDMYYAVVPELVEPFQRRYWSIFVPLSVRRCHPVLANSQQTRSDLERVIPATRSKVRVTPLASRLTPSGPVRFDQPWEPYLLMVANLTPNKNVEIVIEALSKVRAEGIDLRLVHVGRDDGRRLERATALFGMGEHVEQLGKISDERLKELYQKAFAAVNASLYEGFGLPAVEAQSMGAPLVSSNHPALIEAAGEDCALFYDPRDACALKDCIEELWRNPALRDHLRHRGVESAQRLSWTSTAMLTLAAFDEALTVKP